MTSGGATLYSPHAFELPRRSSGGGRGRGRPHRRGCAMNVKRLKAIAKLGLLFGIPISLVLGLFSWGVHVGAQHRHAIASFERDWLGLDVEVPDPPAEAPPAE